MNHQEKSLLVNRISSGYQRIQLSGKNYWLGPIPPENKYLADMVYEETYQSAISDGAYTEDDLAVFLLDRGLWTEDEEKKMGLIAKEIEEYCVKIYERFKKKDEREFLRNNLKRFRNEHDELSNKRHAFDHCGAVGVAHMARFRFSTACSIYLPSKKPLWKNPEKYYERRWGDNIIETVIGIINTTRITDEQFQELARTEPWRSIWGAREVSGKGLFGLAAAEMTDDQKSLVSWSHVIDNVYQSPDRPNDAIIADPDALNGWFILERRKAESEENKTKIPGLKDGADEIFLMAPDPNDPMRFACDQSDVEELMSPMAKSIKKQRMKMVMGSTGKVNHMDFPDVQRDFSMFCSSAITQAVASRR